MYRDYLFNITEKEGRSSKLSAWFELPRGYFEECYSDHKLDLSIIGTSAIKILNNFEKEEVNFHNQIIFDLLLLIKYF